MDCVSSRPLAERVGTNVPLLRQFFNLMPSRRAWAAQSQQPPEFLIDQFFNVPGVGLVVAGTLLSGVVSLNHVLAMGPNNVGKFNTVTVKSIHHMRTAVPALLPGQTGAFVVRSRTKEHVKNFGVRKGMVLLEGTEVTHCRSATRLRLLLFSR